MSGERPFVSVVIPVLDGADRLPAALRTLAAQTYPADRFEVLVVDGGSRDASRDVARAAGAAVIDNPGRRVAPARNAGFVASRGEVVAFTDDDCTFPEDWIASAVAHLGDPAIGGVSGPTLVPEDETAFGGAVAFLFEIANVLSGSVHRERLSSSVDVTDMPGCNCFFRRDALERVMPCDESLVTAEDVELCWRVRAAGYRLRLEPDVRLVHHKRPSPAGLARQMRRYAIGRLQVGRLHRELLGTAHVVAGFGLPLLVLFFAALAVSGTQAFVLGVVLGVAALAVLALAGAVRRRSVAAGSWVPVVIVLVTVSWSFGFLRELLAPHPRAGTGTLTAG